jgi:hypothetical protein
MTRQALELLILRMFLSGYFASSHLAAPTGNEDRRYVLATGALCRCGDPQIPMIALQVGQL